MIDFLAARSTEIFIGIGIGAAIYCALHFVAGRCFDDDDPELDPWDSYK